MDAPASSMPPPPTAVYTDLSTATTAIHEHAKANGYALFKRDTTQKRIVYTCDRYGKGQDRKNPNLHESKQRKGSRSKKCDCKMKIALKKDVTLEQWQLMVIGGAHNYGPSAAPSAHPAYRIAALEPRVKAQIKELVATGLNNAQILATIRRKEPTVLLSQKDISNLVQASRLRQLNGRTPIEWLLKVCYYIVLSCLLLTI